MFERKDVLSNEEELTLEKNLIWIFGANRSGTTWLSRLLYSNLKIIGISRLERFLHLNYKANVIDELLIGQHIGIFSLRNNQVSKVIDEQSGRDDYFFSEKYKERI